MTNPILYILMRTDLPSMNAGKAMAQASHASNAFVHTYGEGGASGIEDWQNATDQGFGTVMVLAATGPEIDTALRAAEAYGLACGKVIDPSYPYKTDIELASLIPTSVDTIPRQINGNQVTLWRNEMTCAYIFGPKDDTILRDVVGSFKLHP